MVQIYDNADSELITPRGRRGVSMQMWRVIIYNEAIVGWRPSLLGWRPSLVVTQA